MSSKPGDELTKSRVLVFIIHTNFIIIWTWNIAGIQCITVKLFHLNMKQNGSDITMRLLHIIIKWNLSDFIFLKEFIAILKYEILPKTCKKNMVLIAWFGTLQTYFVKSKTKTNWQFFLEIKILWRTMLLPNP